MKINFVTVSGKQSPSFRFHVYRPAKELARMGHNVTISPYPVDAELYVFNKHWNRSDIKDLKRLKEKALTVYHVCDNHFKTDVISEHYREMATNAHLVISTCESMQTVVEVETGRKSVVIPDSYEMAEIEPSYNPGENLKFVWFGGKVNHGDIIIYQDVFEQNDCTVVTDGDGSPVKCRYVEHTKENKIAEILRADCVLIPGALNNRNWGRSNNRLVDSARLGKFVIASSLPDYKKFAKWYYIGDLGKGVDWLKSQPKEEIINRIKGAQEYAREIHDPKRIGLMWDRAIFDLCKRENHEYTRSEKSA